MDVDLDVTQEISQIPQTLNDLIHSPYFNLFGHVRQKKEFLPNAQITFIIDFSHQNLHDISGIEKIKIPYNNRIILLSQIPHVAINLNYNTIRSIPEALMSFTHIQSLQLNYNIIESLPEGFFDNFSSQLTIGLSHNQLTRLPGIVKTAYCRNLDVSSNALTFLPENFGNLQISSHLYLHHNYLEHLPNSFYSIQVVYLDMSNNQLIEFMPDKMSFNNLVLLDLSYNNLAIFPDIALPKLTKLLLRHNQLENLYPNFSLYKQLTQLDLSNNSLQALPESLCILPELTDLDVSYNQLSLLLTELSWPKLKKLNLSHNTQLKNLPDSVGTLTCLIYLNLNFCLSLVSLPLTFGKLKQLKTFYLLHVPLFHLPKWEPFTLKEKEYLRLHGNDPVVETEIERKMNALRSWLLLAHLQKTNTSTLTTTINTHDINTIQSTHTRTTYGFYYAKRLDNQEMPLAQDAIGYILKYTQAFIESDAQEN